MAEVEGGMGTSGALSSSKTSLSSLSVVAQVASGRNVYSWSQEELTRSTAALRSAASSESSSLPTAIRQDMKGSFAIH